MFLGMGAETVFDSNLAIVKYDSFGNATEVLKHTNQCIQKALFVLPAVSEHNGCIAVAHTGTEQVYGCPDSLQIDGSFAPVYLHGISCWESKRNKGFPCFLPELMHQSSDRCLTACESVFLNQSVIDPLCGMVLFFGTAVSILIQAPLDEGNDIICNDGSLSAVVLALLGDAVAIPILFVGVAGNVQRTGNLPLAHPAKPHSAYVFVNFQCDNHLCTPPITISDYYKGLCVVAQLFESVYPQMAHLYISVYSLSLFDCSLSLSGSFAGLYSRDSRVCVVGSAHIVSGCLSLLTVYIIHHTSVYTR